MSFCQDVKIKANVRGALGPCRMFADVMASMPHHHRADPTSLISRHSQLLSNHCCIHTVSWSCGASARIVAQPFFFFLHSPHWSSSAEAEVVGVRWLLSLSNVQKPAGHPKPGQLEVTTVIAHVFQQHAIKQIKHLHVSSAAIPKKCHSKFGRACWSFTILPLEIVHVEDSNCQRLIAMIENELHRREVTQRLYQSFRWLIFRSVLCRCVTAFLEECE